MADVIVVLIIVVLVCFALKSVLRHSKSGCCGGCQGCSSAKENAEGTGQGCCSCGKEKTADHRD